MTAATRTKYEVRDVTGALWATHVRIDEPGGKRMAWLDTEGKSGLGGTSTADLPLYLSEQLGNYPAHSAIVITEGEKAARALADVGIPALGTVTGASSTPGDRPLAELTGRHVILWPDADDIGVDHMRRVATGLRGIAASVRWVTWVGAPAHGDAADFLATHALDEAWDLLDTAGAVPTRDVAFVRLGSGYQATFPEGKVTMSLGRIRTSRGETHGELTVRSDDRDAPDDGHLLQANFNVSSMTARKTTAGHLEKRAPKVKVDWLAHLEAFCVRVLAAEREGAPIVAIGQRPRREATPYLIWPLMPKDRATIVFGEGGSGKSFLAVAAAVSVATGTPVVDGWNVTQKGRVLILDWEADADEWNDRIASVARGAGLDAPVVDYRQCIGSLVDMAEDLSRYVREQDIRLVVVDSVGMASPAAREGSDANDGAVRLFAALRQLNCTALLVDHVSKAGADRESGAIRPYGSIFKVNLARSVFELKRATSNDEAVAHVALYHRKCNGGPLTAPMGLRVEYGEDYVGFSREAIQDDELRSALPLRKQIDDLLVSTGPQSPADIAASLDANHGSVRVLLSRGVRDGRLVRFDNGTYGVVTHALAEAV